MANNDLNARVAALEIEVDRLKQEALKRLQAEDALRESEEIHRVTLSNISDAVFLTDDTGSFTYICPNVHIIFEYTDHEVAEAGNISALLGTGFFDPAELAEKGEIVNVELVIKDKNGRRHVLLVNVKRVSIKTGTTLYTCRDITDRKRAENALQESENQLRALSRKVISAQEEEREKLSRELHDELGHQLVTMRLEIDWIKRDISSGDADERMDGLTGMVLDTTAMLKRICKGLRPMITDYTGLGLAVEALAEEFGTRSGFNVDISVDQLEDIEFDYDRAITLYRILQETLTNVARHSGGNNVSVVLFKDNSDIVLEVSDDGTGISDDSPKGNRGLGIAGMRERAALCGGSLILGSTTGDSGVRVTVKIPVVQG